MNIHEKINLKATIFFNFKYQQAKQMVDGNKIALAPYYIDRLIRQGQYVAYRESLPQWVKDKWKH